MDSMHRDPMPGEVSAALFTDLYELTMAQAYDAEQLDKIAVFELAFRTLPPQRNFALAAGLDDVLTALAHWQFEENDLAYLRGLGLFSRRFLERLAGLRFTGDVYAVPEGTPVFANEPLVQIVAPLIEAQLIETLVLNQIHVATVAASKAVRIVAAAGRRSVIDFGSRRAHGIDAAMKVARASYLAGATGTSLVAAGERYGIPVFGTMAHSYVQAHGDEAEAFAAFTRLYPETTLLVDTYDALSGVDNAIELARRMDAESRLRAIRLDSGNLGQLAKQAREMLDSAGLQRVQIFASSELDEYEIGALVASGAPIDGFGVGTKMAVVDDAPHMDVAYKLVEIGGRRCTKLSSRKILYPGRKQVFREVHDGQVARDVIGRHDEELPGERLLVPVMRDGKRLPAGCVSLLDSRQYATHELLRLPPAMRKLEAAAEPFPVQISARLQEDYEAIRQSLL
jgi:nicotinate phosphoribosyltransferase